jgi:hypothetical protein
MKFKKHHLLFIFPLTVAAFLLESVVWMHDRFNRFVMPNSFMFDALVVSFVPFAIYWQMKNWTTCSKSIKVALIFFWIVASLLVAVYGFAFCLAIQG